MSLKTIIAPEIRNDSFSDGLYHISKAARLTNVLETGSSSGEGSTVALVKGIMENSAKPRLFCLEVNKERYEALVERYKGNQQVACLNMSSIGGGNCETEAEIEIWAADHPWFVDSETMIQRLREGTKYLLENQIPEHGIAHIKKKYQIKEFDFVLINGGEFSGRAELDLVYGARYILLDDIKSIKNEHNYQRLLHDPNYRLIDCDYDIRLGYAIFERSNLTLPIEFFTIVLNGMPFLPLQLEMMKQLNVPWRWHIMEGVAKHVKDTAWSLRYGATISENFHSDGLSNDGTTAWIDQAAALHPQQIKVYRKPKGEFWEGKLEMVSAPVPHLPQDCLLWQLDADEIWTPEQVKTVSDMFAHDTRRGAAYFFSDFYVGPELVISTPHRYANYLYQDWLRVWRYRSGMYWASHEPPTLVLDQVGAPPVDVARVFPFTHYETARQKAIFKHRAYELEHQIQFKETYYGYGGAVEAWKKLQSHQCFPAPLPRFLSWAGEGTMVDRVSTGALSVYFGRRQQEALNACLASHSRQDDQRKIVIDGVFFEYTKLSGIARVWTCLLEQWANTPFGNRLVIIDRDHTAPQIDGLCYTPLQRHTNADPATDRHRVESVCRFYEAGLFISTYYSRGKAGVMDTPALMMAYDFIPEIFLGGEMLKEADWKEKSESFNNARAFICISQNTLLDLHRHYPKSRIKPSKYYHLASGYSFKTEVEQAEFRWKYQIHRPYFLLVGARRNYKNADVFFASLELLSSKYGFDVVCTGARDLEPFDKPGVNIRKFSFEDHDMQCAYSAALALVYPSLYEGFGLPILEAMCCDCPVIASNASSIPEVTGDAAVLFDPRNAVELAEALVRVQLHSERQRLIALGRIQAQKFSWKQAAVECEDFISTVAALTRWEKPVIYDAAYSEDEALIRKLDRLESLILAKPCNINAAARALKTMTETSPRVSRLVYLEQVFNTMKR